MAQVTVHDETIAKIEQRVSDTKTLLTKEFMKVREEFATQAKGVTESAVKFQKALTDQKYWFDKYNDGFKEADGKFAAVKTELMGEIDQIHFLLKQKTSVTDVSANFRELGDVLNVKFKQVEDCKDGLRDLLVYQKYFYPLEVQSAISQNMQNFKAAMADTEYV